MINHVLHRVSLDELLAEFVPTTDRRQRVSHAKALGVFLRSLLIERDPIYRQQEMVGTFAPEAFGLDSNEAAHVGDDVVGRASTARLRDGAFVASEQRSSPTATPRTTGPTSSSYCSS